MIVSDSQLQKLLEGNQYVSDKDMARAVSNSREKNIPLQQSLLDLDLMSDQNLGMLIADYIKMPYVDLSKASIKKEVLRIVPKEVAARGMVITFAIDNGVLKIATANPENNLLIKNIAKKAGMPAKVYFVTEKDFKNALNLYKDELQKSFDKLLKDRFGKNDTNATDFPIEQTLDLLVEYAYSQKASDIHVEPEHDEVLVRFRVDGVLHDVLKGPVKLHEQIIRRIKILAKLRTDEHLNTQDGKMVFKLPEEDLDIRVSIAPVVGGEKAVLRLLSSRSRQFGLSDLGMSDTDLVKVKDAFDKPYGMIFSVGPTGSGKTTTIYSILKILNTREKNIATIEDPVEYEMDGVNQMQVNEKTNLTFAAGLRSILRQDPDIIFVGEVRDDETAGIAINSAMTGHLVLSTLHTNDAATSLPRLLDLGIEPFLIASTVNVIIAQRLVRKICEKCRVSMTVRDIDVINKYGEEISKELMGKDKKNLRIYEGKGCSVCNNTGYVGRIGIFEVLVVSDSIKKLITQKADSSVLEQKALEEGMTSMFQDGMAKVLEGVTTLEEIIRVVKQ